MTALTVVLAALALPAPTEAARIKATCIFNGEAKTVDKEDPTIGVRFFGGKGSYTFSSLAIVCVGMTNGVPDAQIVQRRTEGVFETLVCGTGKVTGTIVQFVGPTVYQNLLLGKKLTMHFVERYGVFFWHDTAKPAVLDLKGGLLDAITRGDDGAAKPTGPKDWQLAGVTKLDWDTQKHPPQPPDAAKNHCTKAFTVSGVLAIDEDNGQSTVQPRL